MQRLARAATRRNLGLLLMWAGFLAAAFVTVRHEGFIEWLWYLLFAAMGAAGVVLLRLSARHGAAGSVGVHLGLETMRSALDGAVAGMRLLLEGRQETGVYEVHHRIDEVLSAPLGAFADARQAMIPAFGLHNYAEIMDRFAGGERNVHRAWSASADGYVDEVWACLEQARDLLEEAQRLFEENRSRA